MSRLLTAVSRQLRYRRIDKMIGQTLTVTSLAAIAGDGERQFSPALPGRINLKSFVQPIEEWRRP
jgi:hypothetical protein